MYFVHEKERFVSPSDNKLFTYVPLCFNPFTATADVNYFVSEAIWNLETSPIIGWCKESWCFCRQTEKGSFVLGELLIIYNFNPILLCFALRGKGK